MATRLEFISDYDRYLSTRKEEVKVIASSASDSVWSVQDVQFARYVATR